MKLTEVEKEVHEAFLSENNTDYEDTQKELKLYFIDLIVFLTNVYNGNLPHTELLTANILNNLGITTFNNKTFYKNSISYHKTKFMKFPFHRNLEHLTNIDVQNKIRSIVNYYSRYPTTIEKIESLSIDYEWMVKNYRSSQNKKITIEELKNINYNIEDIKFILIEYVKYLSKTHYKFVPFENRYTFTPFNFNIVHDDKLLTEKISLHLDKTNVTIHNEILKYTHFIN